MEVRGGERVREKRRVEAGEGEWGGGGGGGGDWKCLYDEHTQMIDSNRPLSFSASWVFTNSEAVCILGSSSCQSQKTTDREEKHERQQGQKVS